MPISMKFLQISTTTVDIKISIILFKNCHGPPILLLEIFHSPVTLQSREVKMTFLPKRALAYTLNHFAVPSWCFIGRKWILYVNHRIKCPLQKTSLLEADSKWHIHCAFNFHLQYALYTQYIAFISFCFHNLFLTPSKN